MQIYKSIFNFIRVLLQVVFLTKQKNTLFRLDGDKVLYIISVPHWYIHLSFIV